MVHVKICGVTSAEQARACVDAGAAAIGVNLVPSSPRCVALDVAREIVLAVGDLALSVAVVADLETAAMAALREAIGFGCLQLHGDEPPEVLAPLLPHAYKALRIGDADDVARADNFSGEFLLVDSRPGGKATAHPGGGARARLGGTGVTFDWSLVRELAMRRKLILAGGLTPENVGDAVRAVRPDTVDVASGVERALGRPGEKDMGRVRAFIAAAREASVSVG